MARIVDVFLQDRLVRSYELETTFTHAPPFDQDLIDRARARMAADGYTDQQIAEARLVVRD